MTPKLLKPSAVPEQRFVRRGAIKDGLMPLASLLIGVLMAISGTRRWDDESLHVAMEFPFQPMAGGLTIIILSAVFWWGVKKDNAVWIFVGAWGLALMYAAMSCFCFAAYLGELHTVDNLVWVLWAYISADFVVKAQSHWNAT